MIQSSSPTDPHRASSFLAFLVEQHFLDSHAAERAANAHEQTGQRIDMVLSQLGILTDAAVLDAFAQFGELQVVDASSFPDAPVLDDLLAPDFVRRHKLVPLGLHDDALVVAASHPFTGDVLQSISYLVERPVRLVLASTRDLDAALARMYGAPAAQSSAENAEIDAVSATAADDVQRLRDLASEAPVIRLVNRLLASAVRQRASDVHIEPMADHVRVRYRIDGVLHEVERLSPELQAGVATRTKILARLNIAERRMPQDGRIQIAVEGRQVDLRVSTAPTAEGESIVLRILDKSQVDLSFEALGLDAALQSTLGQVIGHPNGIILVTGPTGSGKTTTLYAGLSRLNSTDHKLFTVEDPIEYHLDGINQIGVNPRIGLTFAHALRSILRQDPDIVMIGEIRDLETAEIAVQASLTGHLVLSTVHTNSAAATITRLVDMGVERYLLASSLSGILAQRLIRRLCQACAIERPMPPAMLQRLYADAGVNLNQPCTMRQPKGCPKCRHTGYAGRTVIAEFMPVVDEVRDAIVRGASEREIEEVGLRAGMTGMYRDGLGRVLKGETTVEEVLQATRIR